MLGKLPVPGRPTDLDYSRARAYCTCSRCGWGLFGHFFLSSITSVLSPSLWETARYRLKYCLKGPLSPKQPTNIAETETTRKYTNSFHVRSRQELDAQPYIRKEIYGDNCDIRVNAGHQTNQNRTKDYHWFISVAADLRVEGHSLSEQRPQMPIFDLKNIEFLPSDEDNASLKDNFKFHILKVITENVGCLKQFQSVLPKFITH